MQDFSSDASNSSEGDLVQEDFSGGEQWEDWEEQNDELSCTCLFSSDICESVEDALRIDSSSNGFDLKKFREKVWTACACSFNFNHQLTLDASCGSSIVFWVFVAQVVVL